MPQLLPQPFDLTLLIPGQVSLCRSLRPWPLSGDCAEWSYIEREREREREREQQVGGVWCVSVGAESRQQGRHE